MALPFVPSWLPTWIVVGNTFLVEILVLVLIWWHFGKRRRARSLIVLGLLLLASEALAGFELLGEPRARSAKIYDSLYPDLPESEWVIVQVYFHWRESPLLGRETERCVTIRTGRGGWPTLNQLTPAPKGPDGVDIEVKDGWRSWPRLFPALWPLRSHADSRESIRLLRETLREAATQDPRLLWLTRPGPVRGSASVR